MLVFELHLMEEIVAPVEFGGAIVQDVKGVDVGNIISPDSFLGLAADHTAHVGDDPFRKEMLPCPLHLNDEMLAICIPTENVKDDPLLLRGNTGLLIWQQCYVGDGADIVGNACVQKIDEEILVVF